MKPNVRLKICENLLWMLGLEFYIKSQPYLNRTKVCLLFCKHQQLTDISTSDDKCQDK